MKSPIQQAKEHRSRGKKAKHRYVDDSGVVNNKGNGIQVVATTKRKTETADKPTTVFEEDNTGYNSIENTNQCPVCGVTMVPATLNTKDGRNFPVSYCLRHRTCLPTGLQQ